MKDSKYLAYVRSRQCELARYGSCYGPHHAHHARGHKGIGQKRGDDCAFCLCEKHHTDIHSLTGPCRQWDKAALRAFERDCYERTRREFMELGS